jgi:hypothetical protein
MRLTVGNSPAGTDGRPVSGRQRNRKAEFLGIRRDARFCGSSRVGKWCQERTRNISGIPDNLLAKIWGF